MERIVVDGVGRLPVFSHASIVGNLVFVSGTLGTLPGKVQLVEGGIGPESRQTLENMDAILRGAGCSLADVAKVSVFVTDMKGFGDMNEAYAAFFPGDPPARITVGVSALALGAAVEMECIAERRG